MQVLNLFFGDRLFSARRIALVLSLVFFGSLASINVHRVDNLYDLLISPYVLVSFISICFLATASVSITIFVSARVAMLLTKAPFLNIFGLIFIVLFQYFLILLWYPAMEIARADIVIGFTFTNVLGFLMHLPQNIHTLFSATIPLLFNNFPFPSLPWPIYLFIDQSSSLDPSYTLFIATLSDGIVTVMCMWRLLIAIIFIISFLFQALQRPIMTLWARIIESDKPVFTLLFVGIAGFAETGQRIAKVVIFAAPGCPLSLRAEPECGLRSDTTFTTERINGRGV